MHVRQVPINATQAGLYEWTMTSKETSVSGHVVIRGSDADPIGQWDYKQGTETWYWGASSSYEGDPSFTLKLVLMRNPDDQSLISAISSVRQNETEVGSAPEVPTWQSGAPLPEEPQVVTLTLVSNGPGQYGSLYTNVSFLMPVDGNPVMPTWYTSISNLYSVFGGNSQTGAPIAEGIEADMTSVESGQAGYPSPSSWYWFGRDPS